MFAFSDTGLFIAWSHPFFFSIQKNKFQPLQIHRFYAWKNKEIFTEWKRNILKTDRKYNIKSHGKCPKYKVDSGINLSWAEFFSAINPFLMSGDNRLHIPENTSAAKTFRFVLCDLFTKVNKRPAHLFLTNNLTIIHDANGLSVKGIWSPSIKKVPDTWPYFTFLWKLHWN